MALTAKQERFAHEYLVDLNATRAAIRAGYSERTANEQGAQLLAKPQIAAAIDAAKAERLELTGITAQWVLRRLVDEAQADIADLYDDAGNLLPVEEWPLIWRRGLVQSVDIEELYEGTGAERRAVGRVKKIRVSDRVRRLEMIGKHIGVNAFQEVVKHKVHEGLADRLHRMIDAKRDEQDRIDEAYRAGRASITPPAAPAAITPAVIDADPAEPEPSAGPTYSAPDPTPLADAALIAASLPAYRPFLPEAPQFVETEYSPLAG